MRAFCNPAIRMRDAGNDAEAPSEVSVHVFSKLLTHRVKALPSRETVRALCHCLGGATQTFMLRVNILIAQQNDHILGEGGFDIIIINLKL